MSTQNQGLHPLTLRHYKQIGARNPELRQRMRTAWGITWRPGGNRHSFLGNLYRPLGTPIMMAQASYSRPDNREGIALAGVAGRIVPHTAVVHYDDVRLQHDFHRAPFVGARGRILDPSDDHTGKHAKGSWTQLALELDSLRQRAVTRRHPLADVPQLPRIYLGYCNPSQVTFSITPALRRRAAASLAVEWQSNSLRDLRHMSREVSEQQLALLDALSPELQDQALRTAWQESFLPPSDPTNGTGLWLLPHELTCDVYSAVRIFEYFGDLVGAHLFNPARLLGQQTAANPALAIAAERCLDLASALTQLAETAEHTPEFLACEQCLIELVPVYRKRLQASQAISDLDLLAAICDYERPVIIAPPIQTLPENAQLSLMRSQLKPHQGECCTDEDLLDAVQNPNGPLRASGMCRAQILRRNPQQSVAESLHWPASELGREHVEARLWPEQDRPASSIKYPRAVTLVAA